MFRKFIMLFLSILGLSLQQSDAQVFSGCIITEDSAAVSYSTIYSRESGIGITADTFSPGSKLNKLTIAVPLAVLPASGNS